jgi:KEOPS complex subunit Cgi121
MHDKDRPCEIRAAICTISDTSGFLKRIREVSRECQVHLIFFDADRIAGMRHAEAAVRRATRSFAAGKQISNTLEMESLLYAAGSRQCSIATSFGIHQGENHLYICCSPANEHAWKMLGSSVEILGVDHWQTITPEKHALLMMLFGITPEECATVTADEFPDLVLERVALLDVYR